MDFALFVALNAVLLIRPEELFPDIAGARLYLVVICGCLLATGPRLLAKLQWSELKTQPITVCVLGLWVSAVLSQLARAHIGLAIDFGAEFGKVMLYYLLLISVLDTESRLRAFLGWIVVFVVVITTLGLLQYYGAIDLVALKPLERKDYRDAEATTILQLCGTGIFNDPNDMCLVLVTGTICALYRAVSADGLTGRLLWFGAIPLFCYAVTLTQSRGGLLGLLIAVFVWAIERFGWKKSLLLMVALSPAAGLLGGRQTNITLEKGDTAIGRVELWAVGLGEMRGNPLTGIGVGRYPEVTRGYVAHNSFVHAYVEMGLLGGGCFFGAFWWAATWARRVAPETGPALAQLGPFVQAIVVGYAGGAFSVSRVYVLPTYLTLGLAVCYLRLAQPAVPEWACFNRRLAIRLAGVSVAGFVAMNVIVRLLLGVAS